MKHSLFVPVLALAVVGTANTAMCEEPAPASAFPAQPGQTVNYRFSDTITTPKGTKNIAGGITLSTKKDGGVQATIAVDGKETRNLEFRVDQNGALQLAAMPQLPQTSSDKKGNADQVEQKAIAQALLNRLSMASRIGAHPGEESSFPVQLSVPWASGPVNPILFVKPDGAAAFTADASDCTSINPPGGGRPHMLLPVGFGLVGGAVGGTTGRIAGVAGTGATALVAGRRGSKALPADITLRISGQLSGGRI